MCTLHVDTNVGSDNFQDRKIHRKGVFRPEAEATVYGIVGGPL